MRKVRGLKPILAAAFLAGAVSGYSQGQVDYGDYFNSDFQITIWSPQAGAAEFTEVQGNSSMTFGTGLLATGPDIPSGAQDGYTGAPLGGAATGAVSSTNYANGNLWSAQLFAAPDTNVPAVLLAPVAGTVANMDTAAGNQGLYDKPVLLTSPKAPLPRGRGDNFTVIVGDCLGVSLGRGRGSRWSGRQAGLIFENRTLNQWIRLCAI